MKAISLWQPWASAVGCGAKRIETRSWPTKYRGELAICSTQRRLKPAEIPLDVHKWMRTNLEGSDDINALMATLPYGKVICVVNLYDCREAFPVWQSGLSENEQVLGCYHSEGYPCDRWAWLTTDLRTLKTAIPIVGRQGLFNLPPDVEAQVRAQL